MDKIFIHNHFFNDPYNQRTGRLLMIETNIEGLIVPLGLPDDIVDWGLKENGLWQLAIGKIHTGRQDLKGLFDQQHELDADLFGYNVKARDFLRGQFMHNHRILDILGLHHPVPTDRDGKIQSVTDLLKQNEHLSELVPPVTGLPSAYVIQLKEKLAASQNARTNLVVKEKAELGLAYDAVHSLFEADAQKLRILYNWVTMTWSEYDPRLIELGFAPKIERRGGGQPKAPQNVVYTSETKTLSWEAVKNATSYQVAYKVDGDEEALWEELARTEETSIAVTLEPGTYQLRVRARDRHGYGDWSGIVTGTV